MAQRSDAATAASTELLQYRKPSLVKEMYRHRYLILLMLPGIAYFVVFRYVPIYGVVLAFKDFDVHQGILFSPWVGLTHFRRLFEQHAVARVFWNTVEISALRIIFGFPMPIILALLMNEIFNTKFKRTVQTISYLPHFLSWVVIAGLVRRDTVTLHAAFYGYLFVRLFGAGAPGAAGQPDSGSSPILIISDVWQSIGWGTIIYSGRDRRASIRSCTRWPRSTAPAAGGALIMAHHPPRRSLPAIVDPVHPAHVAASCWRRGSIRSSTSTIRRSTRWPTSSTPTSTGWDWRAFSTASPPPSGWPRT